MRSAYLITAPLGLLLLAILACGCPKSQSNKESSKDAAAAPNTVAGEGVTVKDPASLDKAQAILDSYSEDDQAKILEYLDLNLIAKAVEDQGEDFARQICDATLDFKEPRETHPAEVVLGDPLVWRELAARKPDDGQLSAASRVFVGNFDKDPEDEVLDTRDAGWRLIDLDGSAKDIDEIDYGENNLMDHWDYDGDGREDLLAQGSLAGSAGGEAADVMYAYSLDGGELGYVDGHPMGPQIVHCDLDGDGHDDLFMTGHGPYSAMDLPVAGFGLKGTKIFDDSSIWDSPYTTSGDIDGDGKDEVFNSFGGGTIHYTGMEVQNGKLPGTIAISQSDFYVSWCHDLTGDGKDELVSDTGQVLGADGKTLFSFEKPADWDELDIDGVFSRNVHAMRVSGENRVAISAPAAGGYPGSFGLWTANGKLKYLEYLGENIEQSFLARDGKGDHIVLLTDTRILCWP